MRRLIISSSQMCISREQEEFLAAYRTDEARQAFIDSYGKEKVNFLDSGFDGDNSLPIFNKFEILAVNGVGPGGEGPLFEETNRVVFSNSFDYSHFQFLAFYLVVGSWPFPYISWIPTGFRNIYDFDGLSVLNGTYIGGQIRRVGLIGNPGYESYYIDFHTDTNVLLPEEFPQIIKL